MPQAEYIKQVNAPAEHIERYKGICSDGTPADQVLLILQVQRSLSFGCLVTYISIMKSVWGSNVQTRYEAVSA